MESRPAALRELVYKYFKRHIPENKELTRVDEQPLNASLTDSPPSILRLLRKVPWLLGCVFLFSFWWDLQEIPISFLGYTPTPRGGLLLAVSVSGLIGFFTNWLAITMLFRPRQRHPVFGQGFVPAQRNHIIARLAKAIDHKLINKKTLEEGIEASEIASKYQEMAVTMAQNIINDPEFRSDTKNLVLCYMQEAVGSEEVRERIVNLILDKIKSTIPMSRTIPFPSIGEKFLKRHINDIILELPSSASQDVTQKLNSWLDTLPTQIEEGSKDIELLVTQTMLTLVSNLKIYEIVSAKMNDFDDARLETLIKDTTNEQLDSIKYLGSIIGMVGGLVIFEPILAIVVLVLLAATLTGLDMLLMRILRRA